MKTILALLALLAITHNANARDKIETPRSKHVVSRPTAAPSLTDAKAKIAYAKAQITYTLKDPESVRWRNAAVDKYGVCIEVNARNSFGGYTGFETWFVDQYGIAIEDGYPHCLSMKWRGKFTRVRAPN